MTPICRKCGDEYNPKRKALGYHVCTTCGEKDAKAVKFCIAPMHKSNYVVITDPLLLVNINTKGSK